MASIFDATDDNHLINDDNVNLDEEEAEKLLLASLSLKKKKKKKVVVATEEVSAEAPVEEATAEAEATDYTYTDLLERIFKLIRKNNPALSERKRHTLPPPQLSRVGTRRTMWSNFAQTAQLMHRSPEHLMSFVAAELGAETSLDGVQRLILKGRYTPKQAESLLKKYINEYVMCHMCRNPETTLTRDSVTRLYFIQCENCSSRRSVTPIKSGFHASMRADRRRANA